MIDPRVTITDTATPRLQRLYNAIAPGRRRPLMAKLGKAMEVILRAHFKDRNLSSSRDSKRARKGFPQSGLWNRIRQKTALTAVTDDSATVSIGEPAMRSKIFGATIRPGAGKQYLAIPLRAVVYGKSPRGNPVPGLFFSKFRGKAYLAAREGDALRVYYRLVRMVRVPRDPDALPRPSIISDRLESIAAREVLRG